MKHLLFGWILQKKYERHPNVPTARFDIIAIEKMANEPDRKMSVLHAILRKEFRSELLMQDVSSSLYLSFFFLQEDLQDISCPSQFISIIYNDIKHYSRHATLNMKNV